MIVISANQLTKLYGVDEILKDVSFHINAGDRVGIVGANGAGKSTLLNILSGELTCDSGNYFISGDLRIGYFHQNDLFTSEKTVYEEMLSIFSHLIQMENDMTEISERIAELSSLPETPERADQIRRLLSEYDRLSESFRLQNGYGYKSEISGVLNSMAFPPSFFEKKTNSLSGGERTRLALAALLLKKPDILLLDEPTNHLDIGTLKWLEQYLRAYQGTVVIISHDRYFLNKVCTQIADIDYAKIQLYAGNYDFWYESSQLIIKQMKEANKKKEEKIKELQDFIQRFSANASKSKQATSRKRALEKIELDEIKPSSRKYPYIDFRPAREIGNEVLTVEGISKTIDGVKVLDNVSFIVNHDDKIAFVGSNELATTTLFNIITGNMEPDEGSYKWGVTTSQAYFPKDSAAEFNREDTIVEWLTQYSPDPDPTYVRGFLGRMLFAGDDGVKKVKVLSGGEKVRCLISKMMICGANVLVFDDPTNHLDMESITALNNGLIKFPGVTLFTSHDHQFIQTTANRIMEIVPSGQLIDKITTYDEYLASDEMARKRQGFAEAASDDED